MKKNTTTPGRVGRTFVFWLTLALTGLAVSCNTSTTQSEQSETRSAASPVSQDRTTVKYAKGFRIDYHDTYKVVTIVSPFEKTADTVRYALVQRGTQAPAGFDRTQLIEIPLRSLVAMSSMHVGLVSFLEAEDILVGLGNLKYVSSPKVIDRINAGKITEVGRDQTINEEQLITMRPDLLMAMGSPAARMERYQTLDEAGIPVLINSEWVETTPLGRAEWVKLMAALLNKEKLVNEKFEQVEKEYNRLTALARTAARKPSILSGMNSKDAWFVPDGDSYMTRFFLDAGGSYHWATTRATGSLPLNFESVYPIALKADYWLNVGMSTVESKQDILEKDARYAEFNAFRSGRIYSYDKQRNSRGANDFWESGAVNPHRVLADLIRILHPELLPTHELEYYRQVL